jgi:hypothetical protein
MKKRNLERVNQFPEYAYGSNEAQSFLAGSFNFQVSEIEVFKKQFFLVILLFLNKIE